MIHTTDEHNVHCSSCRTKKPDFVISEGMRQSSTPIPALFVILVDEIIGGQSDSYLTNIYECQ